MPQESIRRRPAVGSPLQRLLAIGLLMEVGFAIIGLPGIPLEARIALQEALFVAYLLAVRCIAREPPSPRALKLALALSFLFRATLLLVPPFYSDDLYRYLWDGHVQIDGHLDPYLHPPNASALAHLRDDVFPRVNHPGIPTIYPPVAQFLFAGVVALSESVPAMKGALVLADLALIGILWRLLARVGLPGGQVLLYAWSPLVVVEVAGNGHVDAVAALLLIAAIHLIILERSLLSTVALGLSAGTKFLPLLVFPLLARWTRPRFRLVPPLILAAVYLPYAGAGSSLFRGLGEYARRWQHNDSLFTLLLRSIAWLDPTPVLKSGIERLQAVLGYPGWVERLYFYAYPVYLARMIAFGIALTLAGWITWKKVDPVRGTFLLLAGVLLLSPTVHPWYLLWIAPFLVLRPNRAWILLTGLVPLSYLDPGPMTNGSTRPWIRWVEYLPFFVLLLRDAWVSRRRGDPVGLFSLPSFPSGRREPHP